MGTTPVHNIPYPDDDDDTDVPEDFQATAEAVDTALTNLVPNTGVLTNLAITAGTGWTLASREHVIDGRIMFMHATFTRSGAQIDASDEGNITDTTLGTIDNAADRPAMDVYGTGRASLTSGAAQCSAAAGVIRLTDMHSTSRIETAHEVNVYFVWPLP